MKFISKKHVSDFSRFALYITNLLSLSSLVELKDVAQNVGRLRLIVSKTIMYIWFQTYSFLIVDPNYCLVYYVVVHIQ